MILKRFCAENFRNIEKCDIKFEGGVNLLYGDNAQGKTNAVEGIYFFARGKSFRRADDRELSGFSKDGYGISLEYEDKNGKGKLDYTYFNGERKRRKNGYKVSKIKEFIGNFRAVLFCPDDLSLVKGSPELRREFINVAIGQIYPEYISFYANYKKALENRNCLLKNIQKGMFTLPGELESWSDYMAEYAAVINIYRQEYIKKLEVYTKRFMNEISDGKEDIELIYKSDISEPSNNKGDLAEGYKRILREQTEREIAAGVTLFGVHRDDILININKNPAKIFSSQGQIRSTVLSLKLGEGEVNREISGEYPVFLFDDVLSELDEKRREYILSGVGERQIIITSCMGEDKIFNCNNKIEVIKGKYCN